MFKLVVLFAVVAVASARPGNLGFAYSSLGYAPLAYSAPLTYSAPLAYAAPLAYSAPLATTVVKSIPTSISHQSSTVVHDSAPVVAPVVAPAVVSHHYTAPALAYSAPLIHTW